MSEVNDINGAAPQAGAVMAELKEENDRQVPAETKQLIGERLEPLVVKSREVEQTVDELSRNMDHHQQENRTRVSHGERRGRRREGLRECVGTAGWSGGSCG